MNPTISGLCYLLGDIEMWLEAPVVECCFLGSSRLINYRGH